MQQYRAGISQSHFSGKLNSTKVEAIAFGLKVTPGLLVRLQSQRSRAPSIILKKKQEVATAR